MSVLDVESGGRWRDLGWFLAVVLCLGFCFFISIPAPCGPKYRIVVDKKETFDPPRYLIGLEPGVLGLMLANDPEPHWIQVSPEIFRSTGIHDEFDMHAWERRRNAR